MLSQIKHNFEQLIALYEAEKTENEKLRLELQQCKEAGENLRKRTLELESEIETRKLAEAFTGGGDHVAAREKIDKLVREIDKCIALLEQ